MLNAELDVNVPRMYIALRILRAWNSGTAGYDAGTVLVIHEWLDGGMKGPIPWPESPFFAEWAERVGYAKIGHYVGFKCQVQLAAAERRVIEQARLWYNSPQTEWPNPVHAIQDAPLLFAVAELEEALAEERRSA